MSRRWIKCWSITCLLLCGATAGATVWAATHMPQRRWCDDAEKMLRNLEAHSPKHPDLVRLRDQLDRLRSKYP